MTTDSLGTALRDLVDDVDQGVLAPTSDELWAGGRRRRRTARLVPVLAAACVASFVALVGWPTGAPQASVPAVRIDSDGVARLTAYPDVIAHPPFPPQTATPGVTAAIVPDPAFPSGLGDATAGTHVYAISPVGAVRRVPLPPDGSGEQAPPSLSPDGRWVARGPVLTDLVTGRDVPAAAQQEGVGRQGMPFDGPALWSPDSRRVFVGTSGEEDSRSGGLVLATDGSTSEVPPVEGELVPVFAGWLDDRTLLALLDVGPGTSRLETRTWVVGDPAWRPGAVVSWGAGDSELGQLRAQLSPDGSRLLLTTPEGEPGAQPDVSQVVGTGAMMFDPRTGAQLGMPSDDGVVDPSRWGPGAAVGWDGWGCRPAWREGLPVITDGPVRGFVDTDPNGLVDGRVSLDLVDVSSGYGEPCVAFAGDELRGTPVTNSVALWQERLWTWGLPILVLGLLALALWGLSRRKHTPRKPIRRLRPIITQPF